MILLRTRAKALWVWENLSFYCKIQPMNPRGVLKSWASKCDQEVLLMSRSLHDSVKMLSKPSNSNWGLDLKCEVS